MKLILITVIIVNSIVATTNPYKCIYNTTKTEVDDSCYSVIYGRTYETIGKWQKNDTILYINNEQ